jgi:uncharacterized membrane protein YqgA involved in biofilm formation
MRLLSNRPSMAFLAASLSAAKLGNGGLVSALPFLLFWSLFFFFSSLLSLLPSPLRVPPFSS